MSNSSLVSCTVKSPNHSGKRTHSIDRITPHCVVGQATAESIGEVFLPKSRQASCNYAIGKDGKVCLVVDECNRSWCSSSNANDQRAVTIECSSDATAPYAFNTAVYNKLIDLCVDICKRNGKKKLLWISDKNKALAYTPKSDEMLLTVHRWFANKSCPGDWMYARMGDLATSVTKKLSGKDTSAKDTPPAAKKNTYPAVPFSVDVLISDLQIRKTPNGTPIGKYTGKGKFTITKVDGDWGLLSNKSGYIYLANSKYVKIGTTIKNTSYTVQVTASSLNIRKGPGTNYAVIGSIKDKGKYTIVEEKNGWGLLKTYQKNKDGWISLKYTKKA